MKVFFVLKPSVLGNNSATLAKFYDIFRFDGKDICRFNYSSHYPDGRPIKGRAGHMVCREQYDQIICEIMQRKPDWIVVHGRANYDFVRHLHNHGFRNIVVHDQDEIFRPTHPLNIEINLRYAQINTQEHKAIVELYPGFVWLPPFFERYMEPTHADKLYDIGFLGFVNKYRRTRLVDLFERTLGYQEEPNWTIHDCVEQGMLRGSDAGDFYAKCRIIAHIPRESAVDNPMVDSATSSRMFQVLGVGSFYLMQDNSGVEGLFEPGTHLDTFRTDDEFVEKAQYYLRHTKEREKIAAAGCDLVYEKHLCYRRAQQFWDVLQKCPIPKQTLKPVPKIPVMPALYKVAPPPHKGTTKPTPPNRRTDWK